MKLFTFSFCFLILSLSTLTAQNRTQNIRGTIVDKQSQMPIIGAAVTLLDTTLFIGDATDVDGAFKLEAVPIGRIGIEVSSIGYLPIVLNNLVLNSGKELILNLEMEEQINSLDAVTISAASDKKEALNKMATLSARSFTVEETNKYAGSWNDPSRMAANYAGVSTGNDSRNDIIIRGNSPGGLLWRIEGVNSPNPNHFGSLGTTGGPVSILNNNLLANSDFLTGAFPSEYGNALSGVFDINLRRGNNEQREYTMQVGVNGFELGAEGPFSANYNGSYLVAYRYSTIGLMDALGIEFGYGSIPQYQDLTYKVHLPTKNAGTFSIFGMGGLSYIELLDSERDSTDFSVTAVGQDTYYRSNTGLTGINHRFFFNNSLRSELSLAISGSENNVSVDSISTENIPSRVMYGNDTKEITYSLNWLLNKKFSARSNFQFGIINDLKDTKGKDSIAISRTDYRTLANINGGVNLLQTFVQWQYKFSDRLTLNSGLHYQWLDLNNAMALEPRLGLKWNMTHNQSISAAIGLHSQMQPLSIYFIETELDQGTIVQLNKDLDFSKSNHYVLAYDFNISSDIRLKVETYYQQLYNIPVEQRSTAFSALNIGADFGIPNVDSLVNEGTGKNYGVELTLEKFFSNNYYFLVTGSLFDSKYVGSDGVERNTAFNGNYTVNALMGYDLNLSPNGNHVLTFNLKNTYAGGRRYTPVNLAASKQAGAAVYYTDRTYELQFSDYLRTDIKVGYRLNSRKFTQEFTFDIQNIFNHQNVFQRIYDQFNETVKTEYQLGIFPIVQYRIQF